MTWGEIYRTREKVSERGPRESAIRCDFPTLMFKRKITGFVAILTPSKQAELANACARRCN